MNSGGGLDNSHTASNPIVEREKHLRGTKLMKANTRKVSKPRAKPRTAGQKRPTASARRVAKPIEVEIEPEAKTERSPAAWARLIDKLTEDRDVAADRLTELRTKLAPLVLESETQVNSGAGVKLDRLRINVNQTASRITELDDAIQLARVELARAESKAAAAAREVAKSELEDVHSERMLLAGMIDECLETLGELVAQWDASKFRVTSIGRKIHGGEGDEAASIGRQLWMGSRRSLRFAIWKHCPVLAELVGLEREPARWHQTLAEGEAYLSSRMLRDGEVDRFERSLQAEPASTEPTETREQTIARLKRPAPDEGELRLKAMRDGLAEEEAEKADADADPSDAALAASSGFSVRG
jgi:hypothetical protein